MKQKTVHGNVIIIITFTLSGVAQTNQMPLQQIPPKKVHILNQVTCQKDYKLKTQTSKNLLPYLKHGTTEEAALKKKLLKECMTTSQLMTLYQQIQAAAPRQRKRKLSHVSKTPKKKQENPEMSPQSLRRKYLPGGNPRRRPLQAHQSAAPTAAAAQAQPHNPHSRPQIKTKECTTTTRPTVLTRFKPGFEQQTEYELACAFCRPMRTYKEDLPYYPYLVPEPQVNFHLNYKG